jgi:hypothetical protein
MEQRTKKRGKKIEWIKTASELADKLIDEIVNFCENVYVMVDECYPDHASRDPFELAELYLDEKDVKRLQRMPENIYEAFFADKVSEELERLTEEALKSSEYESEEDEYY